MFWNVFNYVDGSGFTFEGDAKLIELDLVVSLFLNNKKNKKLKKNSKLRNIFFKKKFQTQERNSIFKKKKKNMK